MKSSSGKKVFHKITIETVKLECEGRLMSGVKRLEVGCSGSSNGSKTVNYIPMTTSGGETAAAAATLVAAVQEGEKENPPLT